MKKGFTLIEFSRNTRRNKGFTLIELLVVIAVIGLLASIVLVQLGPVRQKARDAKRQQDFAQIAQAMEMCKFDATCPSANNEDRYPTTSAGVNTVTAIGSYMGVVPKDPLDLSPNQYTWVANTGNEDKYYCLYAKLEGLAATTWLTVSHQGVVTLTQATAPATLSTCK